LLFSPASLGRFLVLLQMLEILVKNLILMATASFPQIVRFRPSLRTVQEVAYTSLRRLADMEFPKSHNNPPSTGERNGIETELQHVGGGKVLPRDR
jgi:hypothetical protein